MAVVNRTFLRPNALPLLAGHHPQEPAAGLRETGLLSRDFVAPSRTVSLDYRPVRGSMRLQSVVFPAPYGVQAPASISAERSGHALQSWRAHRTMSPLIGLCSSRHQAWMHRSHHCRDRGMFRLSSYCRMTGSRTDADVQPDSLDSPGILDTRTMGSTSRGSTREHTRRNRTSRVSSMANTTRSVPSTRENNTLPKRRTRDSSSQNRTPSGRSYTPARQ